MSMTVPKPLGLRSAEGQKKLPAALLTTMSSPPSSCNGSVDGRLDGLGLADVGDQGQAATARGRGDLPPPPRSGSPACG